MKRQKVTAMLLLVLLLVREFDDRHHEPYWNIVQCVSGFSKAKSANGGSILSSSQFLILPQLPQKIKLASKVVKVDSKIIISLPKI
jgi:hypothetical protein